MTNETGTRATILAGSNEIRFNSSVRTVAGETRSGVTQSETTTRTGDGKSGSNGGVAPIGARPRYIKEMFG